MNYLKPFCRLFSGMGVPCLIVATALSVVNNFSYAGPKIERDRKLSSSSEIYNQGFISEPSQALKDKFPLCDRFLDVEWINRSLGVGYLKHDIYKNGKYLGQMESQIIMPPDADVYHRPWDRIELYDFKKNGEIDQLFEIIRSSKDAAEYKEKYEESDFKSYKGPQYIIDDYSYSDFNFNVCLPYPNDDIMWVVEKKGAGKVLSQKELERHFEVRKNMVPGYTMEWLKKQTVMDINHDGVDDYLGGSTVFSISYKKQYFEVLKRNTGYDKKGSFSVIGTKNLSYKCKVYRIGRYFLTTDGEFLYLNNQCNLSKLIK